MPRLYDRLIDAMEESVRDNIDCRDITVIFDRTCQRRGHASLNVVVTAIAESTGKVVDARVLSNHCRCLKRLENIHDSNCVANNAGVCGGIEVTSIVSNIFKS